MGLLGTLETQNHNRNGGKGMKMKLDNRKYLKTPLSKVLNEPVKEGRYRLYIDRYWAIEDESILQVKGCSYQCNRSKLMMDTLHGIYDNREVRFIARVWVKS